jgi:hypothetical protein
VFDEGPDVEEAILDVIQHDTTLDASWTKEGLMISGSADSGSW